MVLFLRLWFFLFIIILGEMLLTEIKITIKNTAERSSQKTKRDLTIHMFFETKTVNHKILRVLNENSFREGFYHTFLLLLLRIISYI